MDRLSSSSSMLFAVVVAENIGSHCVVVHLFHNVDDLFVCFPTQRNCQTDTVGPI